MNLTPYVDALRHDLAVAAAASGDDARDLAERLTAPLESAVRLALLDALSAAADEITRDLAPGSVELRLRAREPSFVVTPPPAESSFDDQEPAPPAGAATPTVPLGPKGAPDGEDDAMSRINLRLSESLKGRIEEAAGAGRPVGQRLARPRRGGRARGRSSGRPRRRQSGPELRTARPVDAVSATAAGSADTIWRNVMPAFDTLEPISVAIELAVGDVRLDASDRADTVVHVRPADESHEPDVRAAEQTRVEYAAGRLLVAAPKSRGRSLFGKPGSIDVAIELPAGSQLHADTGAASVPRHRPPGRMPGQDRRRRP